MTTTDELVDQAVGTQPDGEEVSARRFTYWFLQLPRGQQARWIRAVYPSLDDLLGQIGTELATDEVVALRRELDAAMARMRLDDRSYALEAFDEACMRVGSRR